MNRFKGFTVIIFSFFVLFSNVFFSEAQNNSEWVFDRWSRDKDEVFKLAKEQDRYVFLFFGLQNCTSCRAISEIFANQENRLSAIVEDDYVPWAYKAINIANIQDDTIKKNVNEVLGKGASMLPFLFVIDPDFSDSYERWLAGSDLPLGPSRITELQKFITIDLLTNSALTWYKDKDKVLSLAREQNKYIFKLIGKGTSPNSQKVIELLNKSLLKDMLEKNYILWYSSDVSELNNVIKTNSGSEETAKTLPYIAIINPENPDKNLVLTFGYQDVEALEQILKTYSVSSHQIIASNNNKVTVWENVLEISNQINNEQIHVFSLAGQQVASVRKNDYTVKIDAGDFPKGVLIVYSSSGWSTKIMVQ